MTHTNSLLQSLNPQILEHVQKAFEEDMPKGDVTSDNLGVKNKLGHAKMIAKQDLILSGCDFVNAAFLLMDHELELLWHFADGEEVIAGQSFLEIKGNLINVLKAERVALNYLGRFSGIASLTHQFVEKVKHTSCKILDTRKTIPHYRAWEKAAVVHGGGTNHRMDLSETVMIKENHIQAAGSIETAVKNIRSKYNGKIEVETTNLSEVKQAVALKVQRIMLDNMSNEEMKVCLEHIPDSIETEASGNMSLDRVQSVAEIGLQYISVGALTHSAPNADISLLFDWTY